MTGVKFHQRRPWGGQARNIWVELSQTAGEITVLTDDDGVGFDLATVHARRRFGLESMQQRA